MCGGVYVQVCVRMVDQCNVEAAFSCSKTPLIG